MDLTYFLESKNFKLYLIMVLGTFLIYRIFSLLSIFQKRFSQDQIQNTHEKNDVIPRCGGFIIIFYIFIWNLLNHYNLTKSILNDILLYGVFIIFITFIEDFLFKIKPFYRLFMIFGSAFIFILNFQLSLPSIDLPILNTLLELRLIEIIFFSLCISVVVNGVNFIDGTNGLAIISSIFSFFSLAYLGFINENVLIFRTSILLILFSSIILIFNYPFGKIFLGDLGAYFLGWTLSLVTIYLFSMNSNLISWNACLILFYPIVETIFSFTRKLITNKNPFYPDDKHLHILIFKLLNRNYSLKKANNLVVILIFPIYVLPFLFIIISGSNIVNIAFSIISMFILYFLMYLYFLKKLSMNA